MSEKRHAALYRLQLQAVFSETQNRAAGKVLQQLSYVPQGLGQREKVVKFIGYDAGEHYRSDKVLLRDLADPKYSKWYPLMEWGWDREACIRAIEAAGLPQPGKSSCFSAPVCGRRRSSTCGSITRICSGVRWHWRITHGPT